MTAGGIVADAGGPVMVNRRGTIRPARSSDNAGLLELFGSVPMTGSLVLSTRRDPDFFALYTMQRAVAECWVYETGGRLAGLGTVLVRDGWLDGRPARVGYLGDLRSRFEASREHGVARFYGKLLDDVMRRHGCERFLTAVLASNAEAINALVRRRTARAGQPRYHLLRRFTMTSVSFTHARRPRRSACEVGVAAPADVAGITSLLARDHRDRPFGYRFDQGEFEHRLAHWPGMSLERTYVARDAAGRLVGVASAWDPAAVKRYRVVAYRGSMRWSRLAFDAAAGLLGYSRLPAPGQDFRTLYLCNVAIEGERPDVLAALLDRIYADFRRGEYHFFSLCVYEGDPLAPALRGFPTRRLDFHLYVVTPPEVQSIDVGGGRPGFEMALA